MSQGRIVMTLFLFAAVVASALAVTWTEYRSRQLFMEQQALQKELDVLDGDWAVFYPDASGHESLYHVLNAGMMALFGPGVGGIRCLSVILGVLSVALTFLLARQLFGRPVEVAYFPEGSSALADAVAAALADACACVLLDHGAVTVGATIEQALGRMLSLERAAARSAGR